MGIKKSCLSSLDMSEEIRGICVGRGQEVEGRIVYRCLRDE